MMKRTTLFAILAILATSTVRADDGDPPRVTVFGTATTEVAPDIMNWRLQVQNTAAEVTEVAKVNAESVKAVLAFLKKQELPEDSIQTSGMEFGENWVYKNRERVKEGFVASTDISFKLTDFDNYKDLWIGIPRLANVSLTGVSLDTSKRIEHRNATRKKALLAAREKAKALAETLGSSIGKPLYIEEVVDTYRALGSNSNFVMANDRGLDGDASAVESLAPGRIPITMRVKVSFLLESTDK